MRRYAPTCSLWRPLGTYSCPRAARRPSLSPSSKRPCSGPTPRSRGTDMQFVTRTEWGAPANTPAADLETADGVKIHWIGGTYATPAHDACHGEVMAIREEHLNDPVQHWVDIAYNLVVCQHGYVFEG